VKESDQLQRLAEAEHIVLKGLGRGVGPNDLVPAVAAIARTGDLDLGETLLRLAAAALGLGGFSATKPLEYEGLREKYLPEIDFYGKVAHRNSQYALYAAAALRGGVLPDIYADAGWWRAELWQYALYAVIAYVRAVAERRGDSVEDVTRALAVAKGVSVNS
jgi:hypothetical protein